MTCLICLEDTDNKILTDCKCKITCHDECFKSFLKQSNFSCPICRIKRKNINNNYNSSDLMQIVFRLPRLIALPTCILISILFTIFVFPLLAIKEFYGKNITFMVYTVTLYFTSMSEIIYPMLATHIGILCLHYYNIIIL